MQNQEDAPPCSTCGSIMVRSGVLLQVRELREHERVRVGELPSGAAFDRIG